jgi:23S rRNA (cytidine2498-2'-O)-methyltransferase
MTTGYLAAEGFQDQLVAGLSGVTSVHGSLVLAQGPAQLAPWAQNIWHDVEALTIKSVGDAAKQLKARQRSWWPYSHTLHRRTALIQEQLPYVSAKPIKFPSATPTAPLGSYMLTDETTMLAAARCDSPFPNGAPEFVEVKIGPPSRAYLKMFEALTVAGRLPQAGERCLELGAAPGGWTWVLAELGAAVIAYDRAELAPALMRHPLVTFRQGDAFQAPAKVHEEFGAIDWLVSDIICYPDKLLKHVKAWLASGFCRNFICTVKFQGDEHYGVIPEFQNIPGSRLVHLAANKHELTWIKLS